MTKTTGVTDNHEVDFTVHVPPGGHSVDITIRVSKIGNGYLIKAGGRPYFCATEDTVVEAVEDTLDKFFTHGAK